MEKAQEALTQKSDKFFKYGILVSGYITVLLTAVGLLLIFDQNMRHFENQLDFWAVVLRKLAGGGFIAGLSIYLIYNARALFAEATVYTHQRHALRFGRLIAYVKNMQKMSVNEIIKMFKWSENFSNYFKDIKPESSGKTTQTYLTDSIKHVSNGLSRWKAAGTNT